MWGSRNWSHVTVTDKYNTRAGNKTYLFLPPFWKVKGPGTHMPGRQGVDSPITKFTACLHGRGGGEGEEGKKKGGRDEIKMDGWMRWRHTRHKAEKKKNGFDAVSRRQSGKSETSSKSSPKKQVHHCLIYYAMLLELLYTMRTIFMIDDDRDMMMMMT